MMFDLCSGCVELLAYFSAAFYTTVICYLLCTRERGVMYMN